MKNLRHKHKILLELFLQNLREKNRSELTIINYEFDLLKFLRWFEANYYQNLWDIHAEVIGHYLSFLMNGGIYKKSNKLHPIVEFFKGKFQALEEPEIILQNPITNNSRKRHLSTINNYFLFLKEYYEGNSRKFRFNPVKRRLHNIKLKDVDINHTIILSKKDWDLLGEIPMKLLDKVMLNLMYYGGLRLRELYELRYGDFNFENQTIYLKRKGGKTQELKVIYPELIFPLVKELMSIRFSSEYLLVSKKGKHLSVRSIYNRIKALLLRAGAKEGLGPHSFRKACATNLYCQTKDLLKVRDYLGHTDAKVTQTYIDTNYLN